MAKLLTLAIFVWVTIPGSAAAIEFSFAPAGIGNGAGLPVGTVTATPAGSAATETPTVAPTETPAPPTATETPRPTFFVYNQGGCAIVAPYHDQANHRATRAEGSGLVWLAIAPLAVLAWRWGSRRRRKPRAVRTGGG